MLILRCLYDDTLYRSSSCIEWMNSFDTWNWSYLWRSLSQTFWSIAQDYFNSGRLYNCWRRKVNNVWSLLKHMLFRCFFWFKRGLLELLEMMNSMVHSTGSRTWTARTLVYPLWCLVQAKSYLKLFSYIWWIEILWRRLYIGNSIILGLSFWNYTRIGPANIIICWLFSYSRFF